MAAAFTADSLEGRTLLALRAGSGMTAEELNERFDYYHAAPALMRWGLVEKAGGYYRLTAAGRAACPYRNPLAAPKAAPAIPMQHHREETMVTKNEIETLIKSAGAQGRTRAELFARFGAPADTHVARLTKEGAVFKPTKGVIVHNDYYVEKKDDLVVLQPTTGTSSPAPASAPADQPQVSETTAAAGQAEPILPLQGPAKSKEVPVPEAVPAPAERGDSIMRAVIDLATTPFVEIDSTDGLEIAVFNTGRLIMYGEGGGVDLSREVVQALRRYLGLFTEETVSV
ncbi:MAG: hypothetical protein ACM3VY_00540 [Candidatus Bathyarchaeota archaeon]